MGGRGKGTRVQERQKGWENGIVKDRGRESVCVCVTDRAMERDGLCVCVCVPSG